MLKSSAILMLCWFVSGRAFCQDDTNDKREPSLSGTINVVIANDHGIVVLTDSMLTETATHRQVAWPGRKLFQIDDRTICAFAGFASAGTLALPDFSNSVSSIMGRYQDRLRNTKRPLSFSEKLQLLEVVFTYYLTGIANIQGGAPDELQFLLAGYDSDGTPEIGRMVFRTALEPTAAGPILRSVTQEHYVFPVTNRQVICVGGINDVAMQMLLETNAWIGPPLVSPCKQSISNQLLSVEGMKALAVSLKQQTAGHYREVGGPDQIAVLSTGRVQSVEQPRFPPMPRSGFKFEIVADYHIDMSLMGVPGGYGYGVIMVGYFGVYFRDEFKGTRQELDEGYYGGNVFTNCTLVYRGGRTQFEKSNRVTDSDLEIAVGVSRDSPVVKQLLRDFAWRTVKYEVALPPKPFGER